MTISKNRLSVLQKAGYKCKARSPEGYVCGAPAGHVDRSTGVAVCGQHFTRPRG